MAENTRTVILQRGEEEQLQLAVNPKDIVISQPQNTLSYTTILGETVHAARGAGIAQVTLETFLPQSDSRFFRGTEPSQALAMLGRWQAEGEPVRLLISGSELGQLFLICGLTQRLTEGDRDVGVSIALKAYQYAALDQPDGMEQQSAGGLSSRPNQRGQTAVYVTAGGEDLWTIARLYLGDGSRWQEIAARSGVSDPHNLPRGKELYLS